jgi:hypothetical protein
VGQRIEADAELVAVKEETAERCELVVRSVFPSALPLHQARAERTMTQVYAATGVSAPHQSEIERGKRLPTAKERQALEAFYGGRLACVMVPIVIREEVEDG